jgi:hypothetical protein
VAVGTGTAAALTIGSATKGFTGTYNTTVTYTFIGGTGFSTQHYVGMNDPLLGVSYNSIAGAGWTVTKTATCVTATLVSGTGEGGASAMIRKAEGVPGRRIMVGGKPMQAGNFVQSCVS